MKKAHYLILCCLLLFLGCAKETPIENEFLMLKKAGLPIPMKFDFSAIPDLTFPLTACSPVEGKIYLPGKQWLSGTTSYFGNIDATKSYILNTQCDFIGSYNIKEHFTGVIATSTGDNLNFTGWIQIDISKTISTQSVPVSGEIVVSSGTGVFAGVSGSVSMSGTANYTNGSIGWSGNGSLIYN